MRWFNLEALSDAEVGGNMTGEGLQAAQGDALGRKRREEHPEICRGHPPAHVRGRHAKHGPKPVREMAVAGVPEVESESALGQIRCGIGRAVREAERPAGVLARIPIPLSEGNRAC
jgi:hypothetical protein